MSVYGERQLAAMAHYGIDPTDRKYFGGRAQTGEWCGFCANHSTSNPRPLCDLEQARAAEMEELGFPGRICFHCRKAHPVILSHAALCPACQRAQDNRDQEASRRINRRRRPSSSADGWSVRVDDGAGCTERIPRWMVDWDGRPE